MTTLYDKRKCLSGPDIGTLAWSFKEETMEPSFEYVSRALYSKKPAKRLMAPSASGDGGFPDKPIRWVPPFDLETYLWVHKIIEEIK